MPESSKQQHPVMIQIDRPGEELNIDKAKDILGGDGVELDADYGPFLINPKVGRYIVRGLATADAKERLSTLPGVQTFSDIAVQTTKK